MVLPPVDEKTLEGSLKDLKLSTEEVDKFGKAFKDPEFLKMFEEYAKEVSDPKVKAETDLYLRQLEKEGRAEETYGKGVQLIAPTPCFVFKTADTNTGEKLFINVCSSEKLEPAVKKEEVGPNGKKGMMFQIPLSLGIKRATTDKKGGAATVVDFVVHPDTIAQAITNKPIMGVLADTAMETIEKAAKVTLNRAFKIPKNMKFKTSEGVERPPVLSVRTATAAGGPPSAPGERIRPVSSSPDLGVPSQKSLATGPTAETAGEQESSTEASTRASTTPAIRSGFSFGKTEKGSQKAGSTGVQQDPCQPGFVHPSGEVTPEWTLTHRGHIDLADSWGDAGKGLTAVHAPKELVARFHLPLIASAAAVDLDVSRMKVVLTVPGKYHVVIALPHAVDDDRGKAKFDKAKHSLEVVLPVLPPPRTQPTKQQLAQAAAATAQSASQDLSDTDTAADQASTSTSSYAEPSMANDSFPAHTPSLSSQPIHHTATHLSTSSGEQIGEDACTGSRADACDSDGTLMAEVPADTAASYETTPSTASDITGPSCCAAPTPTPASLPLTENERLWRDLHKEEVVVVAEEPEACTAPQKASETQNPTSPSSTSGRTARAALEAAGLVGSQSPVAGPQIAPRARVVPVMQLQPRLTKSLAMDLD